MFQNSGLSSGLGSLTIWRLGSQGKHPLSKRENDVMFYDLGSVTLCHLYCTLSKGDCLQGGVGRERMQLRCADRVLMHGMDAMWLGRRQALDQEPGLGPAPVRKFRDYDRFTCDLACQPCVSLLCPGLDWMQ